LKKKKTDKTAIDMTNGPLARKILLFSLPLMATNVLQLLFNAADIIVVGRFAGHTSLAAVGSTASVINLFITLLVGISVGVNVVIARYIGETGRSKEISRALHTSITIALIGGAVLGAIGILSSGLVLDLISTPKDIKPLALVYVRIYYIGTPFVMIYNYGASALRAKGDTKRPLLFMLVSGTLNVCLNLFFVICMHMAVSGVAIATVISQGVSAVLILRYLSRSDGDLHFSFSKLCFDRRSMYSMMRIGIPAGAQGCLFSLSNVVIQSGINAYGGIIVAGCAAGENIESFIYFAMNSFHHAAQTFISQNIGAAKYDRITRIIRMCLVYTLILGAILCSAAGFFAPQLISIYNSDPAVISAGVQRLMTVAVLYVIFGVADVFIGAIRGYGIPIVPVVINLIGTCVFRLLWVTFLDTSSHGVQWVYASYPISWIIVASTLAIYWIHLRRKEKKERFVNTESKC
jgi:putative efflux protein, MATE family